MGVALGFFFFFTRSPLNFPVVAPPWCTLQGLFFTPNPVLTSRVSEPSLMLSHTHKEHFSGYDLAQRGLWSWL